MPATPRQVAVAVRYPEFGDFCEVAARILGTTPEQIAAGQVTQDEILAWLSARTVSV